MWHCEQWVNNRAVLAVNRRQYGLIARWHLLQRIRYTCDDCRAKKSTRCKSKRERYKSKATKYKTMTYSALVLDGCFALCFSSVAFALFVFRVNYHPPFGATEQFNWFDSCASIGTAQVHLHWFASPTARLLPLLIDDYIIPIQYKTAFAWIWQLWSQSRMWDAAVFDSQWRKRRIYCVCMWRNCMNSEWPPATNWFIRFEEKMFKWLLTLDKIAMGSVVFRMPIKNRREAFSLNWPLNETNSTFCFLCNEVYAQRILRTFKQRIVDMKILCFNRCLLHRIVGERMSAWRRWCFHFYSYLYSYWFMRMSFTPSANWLLFNGNFVELTIQFYGDETVKLTFHPIFVVEWKKHLQRASI